MEPTDVPPYFWTINTTRTVRDMRLAMPVAVIFSTFPNADKAAEIARMLVDERLAACVNLVPGARSIYRWQGQLCDEVETLAIVKTTTERVDELTARLVSLHPYEVPEVIAVPISAGYAPYLAWIAAETDKTVGP